MGASKNLFLGLVSGIVCFRIQIVVRGIAAYDLPEFLYIGYRAFFNPMQVGYFNRSQTLAVFPATNLTEIVNRTMYPTLCALQNDEERLIRTFSIIFVLRCLLYFR